MGLLKSQKKGIFCLEGNWSSDLRDRSTVEPILELLQRHVRVPYIHLRVATFEEMVHYLGKWPRSQYKKYPILYVALHGDVDEVQTSSGTCHTLDELADYVEDCCDGRVIHFGTCSTLGTKTAKLDRFLERTGALAVSGYRKEVDWVLSTAFDLLVLEKMQYRAFSNKGMELVRRDILAEAAGLDKKLGYRLRALNDGS